MSMLKCFLDLNGNKKIFNGLKVDKKELMIQKNVKSALSMREDSYFIL